MMILPLLLFAAAAASAGDPALVQNEVLGIDAPDAFAPGYNKRDERQAIIELIEPPATVENWPRMITLQLFYGQGEKGSAATFYKGWLGRMQASCAGLKDAAANGTVDGRPALRSSLSCPLNPQTGKPENLTAVIIEGDANLMMVQVAFRGAPTDQDKALVARIAGSLKVCDQRKMAACSARKPTGFIAAGQR